MSNQKLILHSENSTNNVFTLDHPISGTWKFLCFNMTNNIFNVTDYNNKIYLTEGASNLAKKKLMVYRCTLVFKKYG